MSGATQKIDIEDAVLRAAFNRLIAAGTSLRAPLTDVGAHLELSHDERFDARRSPGGQPWDAVTKRYAKIKASGKVGGKAGKGRSRDRDPSHILELTGDLRRTLRYQVSDAELDFGTDQVYGATHQFGDTDRNIPAREFLGLSADDLDAIDEIFLDHLRAAAG